MKNILLSLSIGICSVFSMYSQVQRADLCGKWMVTASFSTESSMYVTLAPNIEITENTVDFKNGEIFNLWTVEGNSITFKNEYKTLKLNVQSISPDRLILIFPEDYCGTEMLVIYDILSEDADFVEPVDIEEYMF